MTLDRETTSVRDYERQFRIAECPDSRGSEAPEEARYPVLGWLVPLIGASLGLVLFSI